MPMLKGVKSDDLGLVNIKSYKGANQSFRCKVSLYYVTLCILYYVFCKLLSNNKAF